MPGYGHADLLVVGGNATFPTQFCFLSFEGTVDTGVTQRLIASCRPLPNPPGCDHAAAAAPDLASGIVECVHVMMFRNTADGDLGASHRSTAVIGEEEEEGIVPVVDAAVTIVIRSFVAAGVVIGLVPLPVGTTLILTAKGAMDLAVLKSSPLCRRLRPSPTQRGALVTRRERRRPFPAWTSTPTTRTW